MNFILANVQIPNSSPWSIFWGLFKFEWLSKMLFGILEWVNGIFSEYWLTIIFFTLVMRLITLPIDFGNKYFTKKNTQKMAEMKPEEDQLKKQYAGDPMKLNAARQQLYKKHNYSMGGFCLFSLINIIAMMMVFIGVFTALREVSDVNIYYQYTQLHETYVTYHVEYDGDDPVLLAEKALADELLAEKLNETYNEHNTGFLWVKNIWRPDTWGSQTLDFSEFLSAAKSAANTDLPKSVPVVDLPDEELYKAIYNPIKEERGGWNGLLILIFLAGLTSYFSAVINAKQMAKKAEEKKEPELEVSYSMRKAKEQEIPEQMPQIDPAMMGKMMKYVMPIVMVLFTFSSTAALALYITVSSLLSTAFTYWAGLLVDKILVKQGKAEKGDEPSVINPHAKYFKSKRLGSKTS